MRVIAGSARGRKLKTPKGSSVRPTSDKVRGAVFNILAARRDLRGAAVLDLFAGTGALGIEALSRGAARAVFVEKDPRTAALIEENLALTGFTSLAKVVRADAERLDASALGTFDLVFADPPYALVPTSRALAALAGALADGGTAVVEHDRDAEPPLATGLEAVDRREYGSTAVTFYRKESRRSSHVPERVAIYPGSFDPLTRGHLNLIERGLSTFDRLVVAIVSNPNKTPLFSVEERREMILAATGNDPRIEVDSFEGLLVDYVRGKGTNVVLRGLRAVQDFEYEFEMAMMNRRLMPSLEIVFLMTDDAFFYISSSMVREVAKLGGDVKDFVPPQVHERLVARFGRKQK